MYTEHIPEGFCTNDIDDVIKDMTKQALDHEAKAYGLRRGARELMNALIDQYALDNEINEGDICILGKCDSSEDVQYVGSRDGKLLVKFFKANGSIRKHESYLDYDFVTNMDKKNTDTPSV